MTLIAAISSIAVLAGIGGLFPQVVAIFQARSATGQSSLGWCLGVLANGLLGYVNLVEAHSAVLAAGNAIGLTLCVMGLSLILRYRARHPQADEVVPASPLTVTDLLDAPQAALAELHTTELDALRIVVSEAHEARKRREPVRAAA